MTEKEEQQPTTSPPVEKLVSRAVAAELSPLRAKKEALRQILDSPAMMPLLDRLYENLKEELLDTGSESLLSYLREAIHIEIKHQIRQILDVEAMRQQRIFHLEQFLDRDIVGAVDQAVEKAKEGNIREEHLLESLAHEASLEINQILLRAKKEFSSTDSLSTEGKEYDPEVSRVLLTKVQELDAAYPVAAVQSMLQEKLGITFISKVHQRLRQRLMAAISEAAEAGSEQAVDQFIQEAIAILDQAGKEIPKQVSDEEVTALIVDDLQRLANQYTDRETVLQRLVP